MEREDINLNGVHREEAISSMEITTVHYDNEAAKELFTD